ncbi:peptidase S9 prolyl oligopeptidase [Proteiniborus sp. DW1]|uniref:S9 family peptidase n=1 Tax=Proteiniborus sp. DW1 TaxID=1889883 RepID=UPI00092E0C93|nr:S9 family peptidase [Proteiniborus sp. DW1]SCG82920.1 peptidase S9 prolyl oligopeptidase [Proteiniborus sp. DW1]
MENLRLDDFTKYKFLSGIKASPNGQNIGFVLHQMDVDENKYLSNIYIHDLKEEKTFKLTSLDEERAFAWKDDSTLLFPAIRNKKDKARKEKGEQLTSYYEISLKGGEANKAFEIPLNVTSLEILDEDKLLLTAVYDHNYPKLDGLTSEEREDELKKIKENEDYEVLDEIPFWLNGQGFINKKRNRLYIYNIKENKATAITDEYTDVNSYKLNKEKTKVIVIGTTYADKMELESDIYIYNIAENNLKNISMEKPFRYSYGNFLEDKIVFTGHAGEHYGVNENPHFYKMDLDGSNVERISKDFDYSIRNSVGSDCRYGSSQSMKVDGEHLYFVTTEWDSSFINRIDLNGNIEKLSAEKGSIDGFDVLDGKIHFIGLRGLKLQELYCLDGKQETQLTHFNAWVLEERKVSKPERLTFTVGDNITIEGWVLKPVDYREEEKYPAILDIHGGPKTAYGEVFYHEMQYWANEGYVVFFCNPRGSDGRGNEFADIRGKYGTIDYDDIMKFTDLVLEKYPCIDEKRIGVTGGSYGGFMTNWIIGHTNRFKAAASQRSISNWISKFATTDIGYYFVEDQNAATPWSDYEKLWFHSPMKYAGRVTTPTLFIHSEEDYRCWLTEGIQMFTALKYHGVESRLCMFRGENHELSRSGKPKHRIRRLEEITNWFNKYLK